MGSQEIIDKWINEKLELEDVKEYLMKQKELSWGEQYNLKDKQIEHVASCCYSLYKAQKHNHGLGGFMRAIIDNDFAKACGRADGKNKTALFIYPIFLNCAVPISALEDLKGEITDGN